ncbi:VOC family protein [Streptomyces sp. NPDC048257]|uniref:VOC family protein n=1 Tax=Streptomyces sp. NPDC048257 TaxID=3365526 RepID=UPI003716807C
MTVTPSPQKITTFLMFEGRAEEAMTFYLSLFDDPEVLGISRYGADETGPGAGEEGTVRHAAFSLAGQTFMCIDSSVKHQFGFTPAMSLYVQCDSEAEIERLYAALADQGKELMPLGSYGFSARFGWVDDRFGVSWQLNLMGEAAPGQ